ncbi:MAG: carbon-nitrogen hydrolase family protein [Candidatus Hodarchaeales archaeon]|jgi:predicted amidohydrolase
MTGVNKLKIVSLQPEITLHNLDGNLTDYQRLLDRNDLSQDIDVICFPEYWNGLRKKSYSEKSYQDSISFLQSIAVTYSSYVIGGSQIVKIGEEFHNRSSIINSQGRIIGTYDKQRLFGYELNQSMLAGQDPFHWKLGSFNASICICNDLWSLNIVKRVIKNDTDVIFVPTLSVVPKKSDTSYGQYIWHNLAFIRAKEGIVDPSKRFSNKEVKGKHMISKIESGESGVVLKTILLSEIREQRSYRKIMGLMQ